MTFLRYLVRQLVRDRTFSIVAVLTLALGIGAITAIFTLIDAHDVERLPYAAPEELVLLWETEPGTREESSVAPGNLADWRRELSTVQELRAFNVDLPTVAGIGPARRVTAAVVEPGFFSLLGVQAVQGRTFVEEDRTSDRRVTLVSHEFWQDWLGGRPDVLDTTIEIDGEIHRVVGVLPEGYRHPEPGTFREPMHLVRPLRLPPEWASSRDFNFLRVLARRAPESSLDELRAEAEALGRRLAEAFPETNADTTILARPLADQLFREYRPALGILGWTAGLVLLIVCTNLANLMLMRGHRQTREMAIRSALGSGRLRLVGHLLAEAAVLAVVGGGLGFLLVRIGADGLERLQGRYLSPVAEVSAGGRALLFTLLAAGISMLLFGLLPAVRASGTNVLGLLRERGPAAGSPRGGRTRQVLLVAEVAMATALLICAGLLTRSFRNVISVPVGFETERRIVFETGFDTVDYPDTSSLRSGLEELERTLESTAGVARVALTTDLPFTEWNMWNEVRNPIVPERELESDFRGVSPGYFEIMDLPLLSGRGIEERDGAGASPVVVVNRSLAESLWPGEDPVGRQLQVLEDDEWRSSRVIGVVSDARDDGLRADFEPIFYRPLSEFPRRWAAAVVESDGDPSMLAGPLREAVESFDPGLPVDGLQPMEQLVREDAARTRTAMLVALTVAGLATLLAAVGIFGVMSFSVSRRTRELGIRSAVGAKRRDLVGMVLGQSLRSALVGAVAGILLAVVGGRMLAGLLFGVASADPWVLAITLALVTGTSVVAAWVPARRAAGVDPMRVLRTE